MQLTHIIAEKEKKSSSYKANVLEALSDEKTTKIKKFAREYIHKVLHRLERGKRRPPDSAASATASITTPTTPQRAHMPPPLPHNNDDDDELPVNGMDEMEMSVEEAMDLSPDEDEPGDGDEDDQPTPVDVEPAESDTSTAVAAPPPADPRLRARSAAVTDVKTKEWELVDEGVLPRLMGSTIA